MSFRLKKSLSAYATLGLAIILASCSNMPGTKSALTLGVDKNSSVISTVKPDFSKPLAKEDTPQTTIPFKADASNFAEFRDYLIEQAAVQGFSGRVINQLVNLNYDARVVKADRSQYERVLENRRQEQAAAQKAAQEQQKQAAQQAEQQAQSELDNPDNSTSPNNPLVNQIEDIEANQSSATEQPNTAITQPVAPAELDLMAVYLARHINDAKVDRAVSLLENYNAHLDKISKQYGVPKEVIVGLWGMESNFGRNQGSYDLLDSLASLAYEGRRRDFFTREFFNALRIMELNDFNKADMKSSWAGAVGQIQFMPTSYLTYGADGSGDGKVNIWLSTFDAFASIANYLHTEGWNPRLPWGVAVTMDYQQMEELAPFTGTDKKAHTLAEWQNMGLVITPEQENELNMSNLQPSDKLWLVVPTKEPKQAHLVTANYNVYMHWNRSSYFAFANGTFASEIHKRLVSKGSSALAVSN